jgi:hypothetical protein
MPAAAFTEKAAAAPARVISRACGPVVLGLPCAPRTALAPQSLHR